MTVLWVVLSFLVGTGVGVGLTIYIFKRIMVRKAQKMMGNGMDQMSKLIRKGAEEHKSTETLDSAIAKSPEGEQIFKSLISMWKG